MRDTFAEPEISATEAFLGISFAILVGAIGFAIFDIFMHNSYVLPLTENCFPDNTNIICQDILEVLGIEDPNDQLAYGNVYWSLLLGIVLVTGIVLAVIRIVFGYLAGARNHIMLWFTGFMWFMSGTFLFFTGWIDTLYYVLRGLSIPETLPWLNGIGIFQFIQFFTGTDDVTSNDLLITNLFGFLLLVFFWIWIHYHHTSGHLEKIGITSDN